MHSIIEKIRGYKRLFNLFSQDAVNSNETPTKVAIVGAARTGSSYLQSCLMQHNNVVGYGEIFGPSGGKAQVMRQYNKMSSMPDRTGAEFLHHLLHDYPLNIHAVVFKMAYEQARTNTQIATAWEYLKRKKVKIIHLYRENLLDQYLSLQLAQRTKFWGSKRPQYDRSKYNAPIVVDPDKCLHFIHRNKEHRHHTDCYYAKNPKVNLSYEELAAQPVTHLKQIQEFIGLPYQDDLQSPLQKQRVKSKSEIIENYDELVTKLSGTEWEQFLAE